MVPGVFCESGLRTFIVQKLDDPGRQGFVVLAGHEESAMSGRHDLGGSARVRRHARHAVPDRLDQGTAERLLLRGIDQNIGAAQEPTDVITMPEKQDATVPPGVSHRPSPAYRKRWVT